MIIVQLLILTKINVYLSLQLNKVQKPLPCLQATLDFNMLHNIVTCVSIRECLASKHKWLSFFMADAIPPQPAAIIVIGHKMIRTLTGNLALIYNLISASADNIV